MKIGYIRVSTVDQNLERQKAALNEAGVDKLFDDKASGKDTDRPGYKAALLCLSEGDELVVASMDRLSRNVRDLLGEVERLRKRGVSVTFLKEGFTFRPDETNHVANLILGVLASVSAFEREVILERQREGIAIAKKKGVYKGRQPLKPEIVREMRSMSKMGVPATRIAKTLGVSVASCYRYLKKKEEA
ncbi:recombinase family protein [Sutterella sp.]|uniref:recombinase family protein n=1 Tax=Sutterella sp. TaxID=1981025 RepID=UPI0026E0067F|nr:recombinase family protein [Sutterella sp.]MDO5532270.1 recombinase family protein [Sutterella sp.]